MMVSEVGRMTYGSSSSLPPAMRDHGQFRRKAFHMFGFVCKKLCGISSGKYTFWCPVALKRVSSSRWMQFPDRIAIGFDDHAAFDDFGGLRHIALQNNVLIPRGEILRARSDGRFGHSF